MKLGNHNGNNKGKKYLVRKEYKKVNITTLDYNNLNDFNAWFCKNHDEIRRFIISKNTYNEDAFNDTYLKVCESILYKKNQISNYRSYFHRAYYTNYIQQRQMSNRYIPLECYDLIDYRLNNALEMEEAQCILEATVFDYVYQNYTRREYQLFKMYISLKPDINYRTLSNIMGVKDYVIYRIISKILKDIRTNKALNQKKNEIYQN